MSCGEGCRCSSDPILLWLWCRLAAVAPIQPLSLELPYVPGVALKSKKKKKKERENQGMPTTKYGMMGGRKSECFPCSDEETLILWSTDLLKVTVVASHKQTFHAATTYRGGYVHSMIRAPQDPSNLPSHPQLAPGPDSWNFIIKYIDSCNDLLSIKLCYKSRYLHLPLS